MSTGSRRRCRASASTRPCTPTAAAASPRASTPVCTAGDATASTVTPKGTEPTKASPLGVFNIILNRPAEADERTRVGHFESDLITGSFNRSTIATVFDRASRYLWLADFPEDHGDHAMLGAMTEILDRIPVHLRLTLNHDRGWSTAADVYHAAVAMTG